MSEAIPVDVLDVMSMMERYFPDPQERWEKLKETFQIQKAATNGKPWTCPACGWQNFGFRDVCHNCKRPAPSRPRW